MLRRFAAVQPKFLDSASYRTCAREAIRRSSVMFVPRVTARKYLAILLLAGLPFAASAQEDKKTDEDKPADPDTGESTVEEKTLGILPNPLAKYGVKFAATYIGEILGNVSGGFKEG